MLREPVGGGVCQVGYTATHDTEGVGLPVYDRFEVLHQCGLLPAVLRGIEVEGQECLHLLSEVDAHGVVGPRLIVVDKDDLLVAAHQEVENDLPRRAQHEWFQIAGEAQRIRLL